jgi:hypothetical protein
MNKRPFLDRKSVLGRIEEGYRMCGMGLGSRLTHLAIAIAIYGVGVALVFSQY